MLLSAWQTKKGKIPRFRHHGFYDNAPSHWKKPPGALNVDSIAKGDGHGKGKARVEDTVWQGVPQSMVLLSVETGEPILDADGHTISKGLQTVGAERGHWDKDGMVNGRVKVLTLDEMRDVLRRDPDFAICLTHRRGPMRPFPWRCRIFLGFAIALPWNSLPLTSPSFGAHLHG